MANVPDKGIFLKLHHNVVMQLKKNTFVKLFHCTTDNPFVFLRKSNTK